MTSHTGSSVQTTPERRPELDAMRALVVVGLVFFHASLVFDSRDDFYVKNAETTEITFIIAALCVIWAMPLLFLIAGLGSWHSMRRRGPGGFAVERSLRLGVPLVFATVTLIPVPQWLRLRADPGYTESYPEFLPRFFAVRPDLSDFPFILRGEYFETGHLWFVVLLLTFSLLLAPLVRWVPRDRARRFRDRLAAISRPRGALLLLGLPVALVCSLVGLEEAFGGWSRWAYLIFFLYGFLFVTDRAFRAAMRRDRLPAAVAGVVLMAVGVPGFIIAGDAPGADAFTDLTPLAAGVRALYGLAGWCWLVAILGLLDRPRPAGPSSEPSLEPRPPGRISTYLAAAVLPLYILHQPIVVAVAYFVVGGRAPILVEYLVIVVLSLALTVAAYDVLVRRTRVTRFLFGMREPTARSG
ncbi:Peptidoglycan/LPS O-acetylase OafA/YrhL, contains acyltransferase and SGNH-hydrolase domains [Nonomuraea solani]|uniref:Peptidoglycan/LPS O-acetylase OafA/YrhL, contains acyltransferase and SGNH-hydrolase domains n=1 Tax=Nonomuraea solani TaxID=1144553 RepID=A0A1H6EAE9_9ACTN|nr:acyltransferase family protein [Nonomuraea solani]SEG94099.1 Peptidoglycan/LPS O-acetylase OafA/YrhL, contains acyltransferase and SGNH-hydrolase domains [Nonomuraea solani]